MSHIIHEIDSIMQLKSSEQVTLQENYGTNSSQKCNVIYVYL